MNALQLSKKTALQTDPPDIDRIALYDRYCSLAYGVIVQIIPQPELAQRVLVDLFASVDQQSISSSTNVGCTLIRLARQKALDAKQETSSKELTTGDKSPKHVFNLSFYQGHKPELIAEKLQIPYSSVLTTIRDYFSILRTS